MRKFGIRAKFTEGVHDSEANGQQKKKFGIQEEEKLQ